jgi:replicative DNA helicase
VDDSAERFRVDELEYLLLGAVLSEPGAMPAARPVLDAADFGFPPHALAWDVLAACFDAGRPLDLAALRVALRERNKLNVVEQAVRLAPLPYMPAGPERVAEWARQVAANARARRTARALARCLARLDEGDLGPEEFAFAAREAVARAADEGETAGESWLDDDMAALQRALEGAALNGPTPGAALTTGIEGLDVLLGGLRAGQVYVVAGRTGQGKTAFATSVVLAMALLGKPPALLVSLEMTAEDMAGRAMAWLSEVPQSRIRQGREAPLEDSEIEATCTAAAAIQRRVRLLTGDVTVRDIRARARRLKHTDGLSLVVVDYLQLARPETVGKGTRERDVAEISRGLKRLALELGVPVVALSQLNREADERETPILKDLRESGSIEHDATAVVFLWPGKDSDFVRLIVAKSRFGACGEAVARFVRPLTRFEDPEVARGN